MPLLDHPIIVISVSDDTRAALAASLHAFDVEIVTCATFLEAEDRALKSLYCGILVDLPSIVKAKGEEKIVACSLTGFFPTLRVRVMGTMLIPMTMPGAAKQENSLNDFSTAPATTLPPVSSAPTTACHRHLSRHTLCRIGNPGLYPGYLLGGAFIVDFNPERFSIGDELTSLPGAGLRDHGNVRWKQSWGLRQHPASACISMS